MKLIKAEDLSIGYSHKSLAKNLSFDLNKGDILCISGPNGSGKSTLIKTLLGQIPALHGKFEIDQKKNKFLYLPQLISYDLPLSITLQEVIDTFGELPEAIVKFLNKDFFSKKWSQASGGEKQIALILTLICQQCDVLILDEPFNHIARETLKKLTELLKVLLENKHIEALVLVSHTETGFESMPNFKRVEIK